MNLVVRATNKSCHGVGVIDCQDGPKVFEYDRQSHNILSWPYKALLTLSCHYGVAIVSSDCPIKDVEVAPEGTSLAPYKPYTVM